MTLSISRFRSLLISNQGRVVESWVKITTYQCESWFQIWKLYKTIQSKFFLSRIWLFEAVKITQKILSKRILNKGIKKPRLQFNLRLALIDLRTTGPRIITNKVVSDLSFGKGFIPCKFCPWLPTVSVNLLKLTSTTKWHARFQKKKETYVICPSAAKPEFPS